MNRDDPDIIDALAAEYVLGTLRGAARRRFERWLEGSADVRGSVTHWEGLLGGLGHVLPGRPPPARAWRKIDARLDDAARRRGAWSSLGVWRGVAAAAALALAAAVVVPAWLPDRAADAARVAVVADADANPMWVITADVHSGTLRARAVNARAAAVDRAYELWMLPADGVPRSLGLLPVNGAVSRHDIPPALRALLASAQGLAVSLEPVGGSPTGAPTGPVLFQAPMPPL